MHHSSDTLEALPLFVRQPPPHARTGLEREREPNEQRIEIGPRSRERRRLDQLLHARILISQIPAGVLGPQCSTDHAYSASRRVNIGAQYLRADAEVGYMVSDIDGELNVSGARSRQSKRTIRVRCLY